MSQTLSFYNPLDSTEPKTWQNHTLIMPICAVGNVGQLAVDLLVSTFIGNKECNLIGRIYSPAIMAIAGPNAYTLDGPPSTSTEVYQCPARKLIIIQQRSSYYKAHKQEYLTNLVDWIKASQFERVIILTSSFSNCIPLKMTGIETKDMLRSYTTASFQCDEAWSEAAITLLPSSTSDRATMDGMTFLPGSGFTKPLIKAMEKAHIPAAIIISFCSEGENIDDCYTLIYKLNCILKLKIDSNSWLEPFSWNELRESEYLFC